MAWIAFLPNTAKFILIAVYHFIDIHHPVFCLVTKDNRILSLLKRKTNAFNHVIYASAFHMRKYLRIRCSNFVIWISKHLPSKNFSFLFLMFKRPCFKVACFFYQTTKKSQENDEAFNLLRNMSNTINASWQIAWDTQGHNTTPSRLLKTTIHLAYYENIRTNNKSPDISQSTFYTKTYGSYQLDVSVYQGWATTIWLTHFVYERNSRVQN